MIKHKEVKADTLFASLVDIIISNIPACDDRTQVVEFEERGHMLKHEQLVSDAVYANLLSSMFSQDRAFSRNELDRLIKFIDSEVHASVVLPILEEKNVVTRTTEGYVLSGKIKQYQQQVLSDLQSKQAMVNMPLADVAPWVSTEEGIHTEARMKLVTKSRGTQVSPSAMEAVNKLQSTKFVISPYILAVCDEYIEFLQAEKATASRKLSGEKLNAAIDRIDGCIVNAQFTKAVAAKNTPFSFGVTMDWRGRMYYRSAYIQPQGSNFEKAAIIFANSMPMSDEALAALRIGVANELGRDKLSLDDRIQFMRTEGWKIACEVAANPSIATISKYVKADKCFLALSGCIELVRVVRERLQNGSWEGVESAYVIHQDGTCNGIQHASALLQDRATAFAVNCTAAGTNVAPQDVYGMVAATAAEKLEYVPELAELMTRDLCKKPVMVTGYGASKNTVDAAIADKAPVLSADHLELICQAVHAAIEVHAAAVVQMTETLNAQITDYLERTGKQDLAWRTPDGMIIKQKYMDSADKVRIPSGFAFTISKNASMKQLDVEKMARAVSPNFVHSLDAAHLRAVVRECEHELVAIHDSVGSHPATFFSTNVVIRDEFVKIHSSNPLRTLEKWNEVKLPKTGDYDVAEVYCSTYLFS